jgi:uncharacterized protein involved in exopolysaccharide biosynthesis
MEETEKTFSDYLAVLKRRKKPLLGTLAVILIASVGVALGLPAIYRSAATILIEQQEMPEDLVRSTITSFADQRIQTISQRVMTTANLTEIINKHELYADARAKQSMETVIDKMRGDIHLDMVSADVVDPRTHQATKATIAFTLSYESESPTLAQNVASELVSLFLNENLKSRTAVAQETSLFLEGEAKKLSDKVAELEAKLAEFKERNAGALPELSQLNREMLDRTENEHSEVERQMRTLEERRIYLQSELAQVSPHNELFSEDGKRILGPADRLKVLQTEFLSLSAKYGTGHPDVIRMRKEIDALKQETGASDPRGEIQLQLKGLRADLAAARKKYSAEHPDVRKLTRIVANLEEDLRKTPARIFTKAAASDAENPAYIQLEAQLNAANTELDALKSKAGALKGKVAAFEEKLIQGPAVEQEYLTLARDHENALAKHREIAAKLMEAQLAQSLETERKGEKFTLIEPPLLPEEPAKPNRKAILLLGILFSFGGGIGTAALGESMDTSVRGRKGVTELLGVPPLGIIPYINTAEDFQRLKRTKRHVFGAAVGVLILGIIFIHFFIVPLDVLWYSALKRLGG